MTKTCVNITILTGPTASGKTAHAIGLAHEKDGVILNADAMQMYDALPILTAQPDADEQAAAPHRLYGTLKAGEDVNAAGWTDIALEEIEKAAAENKHPIFVGGTGFYILSLVKGLSPIPEVSPDIREGLNHRAQSEGTQSLYEELQTKDPEMATRLKSGDTQRIIRALEILQGTGKSLKHWQDLPLKSPPAHYHFHIIAMRPDIEKLNAKINARIDVMLEQGALEEIKQLSDRIDAGEVSENALIVKAHGFRPFRKYLKGEISREEAKTQTATETRQYAKRQRTWARQQYRADKLPTNASFEFLDI
jgi:tRNA dimethylallyltransferase